MSQSHLSWSWTLISTFSSHTSCNRLPLCCFARVSDFDSRTKYPRPVLGSLTVPKVWLWIPYTTLKSQRWNCCVGLYLCSAVNLCSGLTPGTVCVWTHLEPIWELGILLPALIPCSLLLCLSSAYQSLFYLDSISFYFIFIPLFVSLTYPLLFFLI